MLEFATLICRRVCISKHLLRRHIWGKFRGKSKPHFHFNSFWQRLQTPKIYLSWLGKGENRWEIGLDLLAGMVLDERLISKQNSLTFLFCKLLGRWTKTFRHPSSPKWHFQFRLLGPRTWSQKWRSKWWIGVQVELFISVSVNSVWPLILSNWVDQSNQFDKLAWWSPVTRVLELDLRPL